jgi:PAS domain S-box-containing protein
MERERRVERLTQLEAIVESSQDAIIGAAIDGTVRLWNPAAERLFGYTAAEAIGRHASIIVPESRMDDFRAYMQRLARGECIEEFETKARRKDGTTVFVAMNITPTRDRHGHIVGASSICRNITDRKLAEQRLAHFSAIVNCSQDAIIGMAPDGTITSWNQGAERLYGYTAAEAVGQSIVMTMPVQSHEEAFVLLKNIADGVVLERYEARRLRKDGSLVDVAITLSSAHDESGRTIGASAIVRDTTERRRAESVLRESEERYRCLVENLHLGITLIDEQYRILAVNQSHARMVGRSVQDCIGEQCFRVFEKRDRPCSHCPGAVAMSTGQRAEVESTGVRDDGIRYGARVQAFPVRAADGAIQGFIELVEDITDRKNAERELTVAKQAAEAASRAKSEFLANMSHEIRTPMGAVLGFADLLLESVTAPEAVDAVKTIRRNGQYLLDLINGILDLSKIEAGKLTVDREPCSPLEIADEVVALMHVRAEAKSLRLEMKCEGTVPDVIYSDRTRLRQILVNLVGNAIKFTELGLVRVIVRGAALAGPLGFLQFDVTDTGIGMSPEHQTRLFQPFTQADASTSRRFGGTGLGLTISKRLAEMLGGDIFVRSRLGEGSTFTLALPTAPPERAAAAQPRGETTPPASPVSPAVDVSHLRLSGRVLLAEDGPDNQRLVSFLLRRAGAEIVVADNGQIAVDLARKSLADGTPFDIILMDMQMPVMDGYAATRTLRADGWAGPIIAVTAHAMVEDRQRCLAAGCTDYLPKPIDKAGLLGRVALHLEAARQAPRPTADKP